MVLRKQQQKNHIHPTTNTRAHKTNKRARKQSNSSTVLSKSNQCIFKKINPRQLETTVVLIKWNYPSGTEMRQVNLRRVGRTGHKPTGAWVKVCARRSRVSSDGARGRCSLGLRGGGVGAATPAPAGRPPLHRRGPRGLVLSARAPTQSSLMPGWTRRLALCFSSRFFITLSHQVSGRPLRPQHRPPPPWPPLRPPGTAPAGPRAPFVWCSALFLLTDWLTRFGVRNASHVFQSRPLSSRVSAFPRVRFYFAHDRCLFVRVRCSVAAHRVLYVFLVHRCRPGIMQLGPGNRGHTTLALAHSALCGARGPLCVQCGCFRDPWGLVGGWSSMLQSTGGKTGWGRVSDHIFCLVFLTSPSFVLLGC